MGFAVKYDQMNAMWYSIQSACAAWNDALVEIGNQVKVLSQTTAMSGQGADNLRNYIAYVHGFAIEALSQVISAQQANSTLYKDGYLNGIDDSLHAVILEDELQDIRYHLRAKQKDIGTIDSCVRSITAGISDLYATSYEGSQQSDVFYQQGEDYALKLGTDIISYENRCVASNFTETELLIRRLTEYLKENLSRERVFKESFDVQAWIQSEKTAALYEASVAQSKDIEAKADVIQAAFEREYRINCGYCFDRRSRYTVGCCRSICSQWSYRCRNKCNDEPICCNGRSNRLGECSRQYSYGWYHRICHRLYRCRSGKCYNERYAEYCFGTDVNKFEFTLD